MLSFAFDGIFKGSEVSLRISYFSLEHSQGVTPINISYKIIPTAKISLQGEYKFLINASGGMYKGVPTLCFVVI